MSQKQRFSFSDSHVQCSHQILFDPKVPICLLYLTLQVKLLDANGVLEEAENTFLDDQE